MLSNLFHTIYDAIMGFVFKRINFLLYLVMLLCFSLMLAMRIALIFSYAPDISVGEDNNVWNVQKVLLGKPLYTNAEEAPFEVFQYTPLSQYPVIWTARIMNVKPGVDVRELFAIGRIYSLLYVLLCAGLIFYSLKKWFNVRGTLACFASFVTFIGLTQLSFTLRPDALLSLTFISAILFFLKFLKDKKRSGLIMASLLAVLAIFTKQNGIQLPIIFIAFALVFTDLKTTIKVTCWFLAFFTVFFILFYALYGQQFLIAAIGGIDNPVDLLRGYQVWDHFFFMYMPFVIGFAIISLIFLQKGKSNGSKFLSVALISTFLFAFVTMMKDGSWINYFSEFFIIGNIATAIYLDEQIKLNGSATKYLKFAIFIFMIFWGLNTFVHQFFHRHAEHLSSTPKIQYFKEKEVADFLMSQKIPVNTYVFTPLKHLKNFIPQYSILPNTEYYTTSKLNFDRARQYSESGKISYIILDEQDFPKYRTIVHMKMKIEKYLCINKLNNVLILKFKNE